MARTEGASQALAARADSPQAFRWRLLGVKAFPIEASARLGEATRNAVFRAAKQRGFWPLPDWLHHSDDPSHGHAFYLPQDVDGDGVIDHVVMFAERGLPDEFIPALAEPHYIYFGRSGDWRLAPDLMGRRGAGGLFGPARRWISATPFVTARHRRGRRNSRERATETAKRQLIDEIVSRPNPTQPDGCMPTPVQIATGSEIFRRAAAPIAAEKFKTMFEGAKLNARRPGDAVASAVEIVFAKPVWGPLAFGFGAHFGLGLFEPADEGAGAATS